MAAYERFVHSDAASFAAELAEVDRLAALLTEHVAASEAIDRAHQYGAQSRAIQAEVATLLVTVLGFAQEVVVPPSTGFVTLARPDFYYPLSPGRGVLAEVERGGTTNNNHDLKDVWKAHISPDAQHLFLVVPVANWNAADGVRERPFARVIRRMGSFFGEPRREVDILSAHVFGYGRSDTPWRIPPGLESPAQF
ncbi:MAG TPA: hypothetical protein VNA20_06140 [Frankiaceae bacterium]|nr:hypothetical protein [Frankiaceae bacterium]